MIKWAGLAMAAALMIAAVRGRQPGIAMAISLGAGAMILLGAAQALEKVLASASALAAQTPLGSQSLPVLIKVLGISYLCEFAAQTCRDAGEEGLGQKVILAGRIAVMTLMLPVMNALAGLLLQLA